MKKLFHILFIFAASLSCLGEDALIASNFDRLIPVKVPPAAIPGLKKRNIDITALERMPQPSDWDIVWKNYPDDCRLYAGKSNWGITTSGKLTISSKAFCRAPGRNLRIRLEAEMPADAQAVSSQVSVGINRYGMINRGDSILEKINIKRGEEIACDVPLRFDQGVPPFRLLLQISGGVILKKVTLQELPDDLAKADITVLEGTLKELSAIPDPKKSDYPDCRFTALMVGNSIIGGAICPRNIQLIIDGFGNYKLLPTSKLKPGDKVRCFVIPFERLPEEKKATQQADDLNLFELPNYYVLEIAGLDFFSRESAIPFSDRREPYTSVFERKINPSLSAEDRRIQQEAIRISLAQIDGRLKPYTDEARGRLNSRFAEAWKAEKAKDAPGVNRIGGTQKFVWRNIDDSFWALPEHYSFIPKYRQLRKDTLDALLAFQDFLNANGCQLVIAIIPNLYSIAARVINKEFRDIPDFVSAWLARELMANNIEALYVSDRLLNAYNRYSFAYFFPVNGHPSDTTQDVLTDILAETLERYHFPKTLGKERFSIVQATHAYGQSKQYLFPENCDIWPNKVGSAYMCRKVLYDGQELFSDPQSPVLILGNSFIQTPMNYPDSLPTLLSFKTHMGMTVYRSGAHGPLTTIMNHIFSTPEKFIRGKRVVILAMGVDHFFASIRASNMREMDRQMSLLSEKIPAGILTVKGNTNDVPNRLRFLDKVRGITIPDTGKYLIADQNLPDNTKDTVLMIPVCAGVGCEARLKVNDRIFALPESQHTFRNNIIVTVPKQQVHLTIELEGKPGTIVAFGDIQLYQ